MLNKEDLRAIEAWLYAHARPLEIAKWNLLFGKGSQEALVAELVKYQNPDGGFGSGFECDILTPESAAIPSAEAIFIAQDYGLDIPDSDWGKRLLAWLETTAREHPVPAFWEEVPPSAMDYPHAPWWNYSPCTEFSPNPCAVVASALLFSETPSQRALGETVARACIDYIHTDEKYWDHDTLCLQRLCDALRQMSSPLYTKEVAEKMDFRVLRICQMDASKWMTEYCFQPIELAETPDSTWYSLLAEAIPANLDFCERQLRELGHREPNFSWGDGTDIARQVTENWRGYGTVKWVRSLKAFGRVPS